MYRRAMFAAALVAVLAVASAARDSSWERRLERMRLKGSDLDMLQWMVRAEDDDIDKREKTEHKAIISVLYEVPPSMQDKFIKEWEKVEDKVQDEKHNIMYTLSRHKNDNNMYRLYGEWEDMKDWFDHLKSGYVEDFLDWVDDNDITFEMFPLRDIIKDEREYGKNRRNRQPVGRKGKGGGGMLEDPAHILITYHVPPHMTTDFVDAWHDTAKTVWDDEKDNTVYALRKLATMNHHYYVYGSWDCFESFLDHFNSKHVQRLHDFADGNDIMWRLEPLELLGKSEEEEEKVARA